jgi:hypothetical protein
MTYTACITCKEPFSKANVFTVEGARETQLSGMCECCFDALFEGMDDEEEYD